MLEMIEQNESMLRLGFFVGMLLIMGVWEWVMPFRNTTFPKAYRWLNNLALVVLNTVLLRMLFPAAAVGMAIFADQQGWGVLSVIEMPLWLSVLMSIVVLDFMIWLQHVTVHAIPVLWRLHRVHHADRDYDVTTGLRFHPLEIVLSMMIKFIVIVALGPPVVAVILFEIILNAMAMFNHGNVRLPSSLDTILRVLLVTPDMHRIHHSVQDHETNSNFGFNLSIWDRLFGTYIKQPEMGQKNFTIGIEGFDSREQVARLDGLLLLPFKGHSDEYVINRRSFRHNKS